MIDNVWIIRAYISKQNRYDDLELDNVNTRCAAVERKKENAYSFRSVFFNLKPFTLTHGRKIRQMIRI